MIPKGKAERFIRGVVAGMLVILCAGCGPRTTADKAPSVEEIIVKTAQAAQTQTAMNLPTVTQTITPTVTPTLSFPTATSTPTFPFGIIVEAPSTALMETPNPILVLSTNSNTGNYKVKHTDAMWSCVIVGKDPPRDAIVQDGKNFYVSWTVVNNGTATWTRNGVDFVYDGGFRHEGGPIMDMAKTVLPGNDITLKVLIVPPSKADTYHVIWSLQVGNTRFCHMFIGFTVKK